MDILIKIIILAIGVQTSIACKEKSVKEEIILNEDVAKHELPSNENYIIENEKTESQVKVDEVFSIKKDSVSKKQVIKESKTIEIKEEVRPAIKVENQQIKDIPILNEKNLKKEDPIVSNSIIDHQIYNALLQKYVSTSGKVNYKLFRSEISNLNEYLAKMSDISLNNSMGANEKLAFWINVYNASTLKLILDSYPVKSIKDINNGSPWDLKWIKLNNRTYSLNEIENDIIRKQFKEPRIHFALNCAAKSCPPLFNIAFDNDNISSLLESQTKSFINSTENNVSKTKIVISRIFEWYSVDFGNVVNFINKYHTKKANLNASISYKSYDWALNE